jgi:hypothetical protein
MSTYSYIEDARYVDANRQHEFLKRINTSTNTGTPSARGS